MKNQDHLELLGSDSKVTGEKRPTGELCDKQGRSPKRIKMKDLESVLGSPEIVPFDIICKAETRCFLCCENAEEDSTHRLKSNQVCDQFQLKGEMSQMTNVPVALDLDASQEERSGRSVLSVEVNPCYRSLDLNNEAYAANISPGNGGSQCTDDCNRVAFHKQQDRENGGKCVTAGGIDLDLNEEDVASSVNQDLLYNSRKHDEMKSRTDFSECSSATGPLKGSDPLRVWTEMKQNGFLSSSQGSITFQSGLISSSHGGIPMPKQRGRKSKSDVVKKRMELAKKEQVDRFTKLAAPSGLLNGLNPGIINHVRNQKQVHSIIEALVRSEKAENGHVETKQESHVKVETKEITDLIGSGLDRIGFSQGSRGSTMLSGSKHIEEYHLLSGKSDLSMMDKIPGRGSAIDGDALALRLSTSGKASEESSTFSNEDSTNGTSISSLSVRAASVASQWLELLHQDIKGRLLALRRSKKRVQAVITTELPFLLSKEFASNQENDPNTMKTLSGLSNSTVSAIHQTRWTTLFDQMDKALREEEKQLETWLNQVKEMQSHCDQGLQNFQWNAMLGFQLQETSENHNRIATADVGERELAVRAAAASIYSTCNFLMSKENSVSCFSHSVA